MLSTLSKSSLRHNIASVATARHLSTPNVSSLPRNPLSIPFSAFSTSQKHYSTTIDKIHTHEHIYNLFLQNKQVLLSTFNMHPQSDKDPRINTSWCPAVMLNGNQTNTLFGEESHPTHDFQTFQNHQLIFVVKKTSPHISSLGINMEVQVGDTFKLSPVDRVLLEERREVSVLSSDVLVAKMFKEKNTGRQPPKALLTGGLSVIEDVTTQNAIWSECFESHPHVHWKIKQKDVLMFRFRNADKATYVDLTGEPRLRAAVELKTTTPDPLAETSRDFVKRLNHDRKLLGKIVSKGYQLDLSEYMAFDLDRYGIHVFGKDKFTGEWSEYYLEFGDNEVYTDAEQVQNYLFNMQTV